LPRRGAWPGLHAAGSRSIFDAGSAEEARAARLQRLETIIRILTCRFNGALHRTVLLFARDCE